MFLDFARIQLSSGKGGDGHVSFRREKFVPDGGPDGGNGGRGGDVIFQVDEGMNTLFVYKHRYNFRAQDGQEGGKRRCHGKNGEDIILKVPKGTLIRDEASGQVIADMSGSNTRQIVLKGGRGGKGNMNYVTPTMQAPQYAQPGQDGITLKCILELKLVADVGLVGFPNAGKSTFLSRVTNADPKIAPYPFTTIDPNLGVVNFDDAYGFVIADMPGLIEGASEGVGLGHRFLRHIERTRVLIHLVDTASFDGRDPVEDVAAINKELENYNPDIMKKPMVIAANKIDVLQGEDDPVARLKAAYENEKVSVYPISAVSGQGVRELLNHVRYLLENVAPDVVTYEPTFFPETMMPEEELPYTIVENIGKKGERIFVVEGPKIEKMLGYTNIESEKGFLFFQKFCKTNGIEEDLKRAGIKNGDTVRMYGHAFDYYSEDMTFEPDLEDEAEDED